MLTPVVEQVIHAKLGGLIQQTMKTLAILSLFSVASISSAPVFAECYDVEYMAEMEVQGGRVEGYLIPVVKNFDPMGVDIVKTYKEIATKKPYTFSCVMSGMNGQGAYSEVKCTVKSNGRIFSPWGGEGLVVQSDGNTEYHPCMLDASYTCIEDANGTRVYINNVFVQRPYRVLFKEGGRGRYGNYKLLTDCKSGVLDVIAIQKAFEGYALLFRTRQLGIGTTYRSAPKINF